MALIPCPSCGKPISDKATQCPHCGKNFTNVTLCIDNQRLTLWQLILWVMLKVSGIAYIMYLIPPAVIELHTQDVFSSDFGLKCFELIYPLVLCYTYSGYIAMLLAFFVMTMTVNSKTILNILSFLWITLLVYVICILFVPDIISNNVWLSYRILKLIFLGLSMYKLAKTPFALPLILYIISSICKLIIIHIDATVFSPEFNRIISLAEYIIFPLIWGIYYLTISKSSWRKLFNSQQ